MPDVATVLKEEITRLARKEVKQQVGPLKMTITEQRRTIAELNRQVAALAPGVPPTAGEAPPRRGPEARAAKGVRFSPKWVKAHRKRLGLSAQDYGLLAGVSAQTIYIWESGTSKPRATALAGWANVRAGSGSGRR